MEKIYDYDAVLYDRRFMSCGQRHAIVFLAERGVPVNLLFCSAWMSSDLVYQQVIVDKRPKYAFECDFYEPQDLARIGVTIHELNAENYEDIAQQVDKGIDALGFVLLSGDVFYFPHCPEYRNAHASHIVVLRAKHANGLWQVVDDNAASVLCEYQYDAEMVERFFNNNFDRKLRHFELAPNFDRDAAKQSSLERLAALVRVRQDSGRFYDEILDIYNAPYDSLTIKLKALHDAFCLLSGSRSCVAQYLSEVGAPTPLVQDMRTFAEQAMALKGMMVKGQITRNVNREKLRTMCSVLKELDLKISESMVSFCRTQNVGADVLPI